MIFKNLCLQLIYLKTRGDLLVDHRSAYLLDVLLDQTVPLLHNSESAFLAYCSLARYIYRNAMFLMQEAHSGVDEDDQEDSDDSPVPMHHLASLPSIPAREGYSWIYTGHPYFANFISMFETLLQSMADEDRKLMEALILYVTNKSAPQYLAINLLWLYYSTSYYIYIEGVQNLSTNHNALSRIHSHLVLNRNLWFIIAEFRLHPSVGFPEMDSIFIEEPPLLERLVGFELRDYVLAAAQSAFENREEYDLLTIESGIGHYLREYRIGNKAINEIRSMIFAFIYSHSHEGCKNPTFFFRKVLDNVLQQINRANIVNKEILYVFLRALILNSPGKKLFIHLIILNFTMCNDDSYRTAPPKNVVNFIREIPSIDVDLASAMKVFLATYRRRLHPIISYNTCGRDFPAPSSSSSPGPR